MKRLPHATPRILTGLIVAGGLLPMQLSRHTPDLVAERLVPGGGWLTIGLLAVYAGWLVGRMQAPGGHRTWRRRVWLLFSLAFYGQLLLGLAGLEQFLMTGKLHFPIPALIAAGPAYRGGGLFMPILFLASVLVIGPAWCSHLCYLGAWDHAFSRLRRKPRPLPAWTRSLRWASPLAVIGAALALRYAGAGWVLAGSLALGFGLVGVAVMGLWSARTGTMVHCTVYCPIGPLAGLLGKINPFRMRIHADCDACGSCTRACRYSAVTGADLALKRVGPTCTLCGDCVSACHKGLMTYHLAGQRPETARATFLVVAVSLHAVFLGVAMI